MIEKTDVMIVSASVVIITGLFIAIRYAITSPVANVSNITIDKYKDL
jgi:hypothetical protein